MFDIGMRTTLLFTVIAFEKLGGGVWAYYRLGLEPDWRWGRGKEPWGRPY